MKIRHITLYTLAGTAVQFALEQKTYEKFERRWRRAHHGTLSGKHLEILGDRNQIIWRENIRDIPKKYNPFFVID